MFGLKDEDWQILENIVINPLKTSGANIWIFGSRVKGNFKTFSDIDILYEFSHKLSDQRLVIAEIEEQILNSNLPIKVDLVDRQELADSFKQSVEIEKIAV